MSQGRRGGEAFCDSADRREQGVPDRRVSGTKARATVTRMTAPDQFGCDFCRDDQNRWFGHLAQLGSDERGMLLLRCPRCHALYENTAGGLDETRRLTPDEASRLFGIDPATL
jgi:hypothetical protein